MLEQRGVVALALGGGLADEQPQHDAGTVFDLLGGRGHSSHVVETCRAAWRSTRNPMALLLPLVWEHWMANDVFAVQDDRLLPSRSNEKIPGYAIDQFTRVGGQVARAYLAQDRQMRRILDDAEIGRLQQPRVVGDLIFLIEGGLLKQRAIWPAGDALRLPVRALRGSIKLGSSLTVAMAQVQSKGDLIASLREEYLYHSKP